MTTNFIGYQVQLVLMKIHSLKKIDGLPCINLFFNCVRNLLMWLEYKMYEDLTYTKVGCKCNDNVICIALVQHV